MSPASMLVRLHDVAFPLLVAAADWCSVDREPTYGFLLKDQEALQIQGGEGAGNSVSVAYIHPRLPAASAGLRLADQLISVNERTVRGIRAEEVSQWIRRMTIARIQPLQLEVARGGSRQIVHLWAVPACQFSVQLLESNQINGIADGRRVGVTTGAMRFVHSDDELAWLLAHEIAHNLLNHSQNVRLSAMLNAFLGATTGASPEASVPSERRSLEAQADYVGAFIMARAGYDVQAIKQFWRRMESLRSRKNTSEMDVSHPTTDERLASFEITLKEIQEKRDRGESLQPVLDNTQ
ncbi:MAG: M48 family metallopeptidase [Nitrospiraceae bacterium]